MIENPVCQALSHGDVDTVRQFVRTMFDYELTDVEVALLCKKWGRRDSRWTVSAGPAMWIKNRLMELGCFRVRHDPSTDFGDATTAVLHVFFMSLEETAEMILFLQNEREAEHKKKLAKVARSKLFGTPLVVAPVDSTAGKVAPMP